MLYSEVRGQIRTGDLIFFHGRGAVTDVIRIATRSDFAHVALAWVVAGRVLVIEAREKGGVQIHALSSRLGDGASWLKVPPAYPLDLPRAILDLDKPYSLLNCIRAFVGLPGIKNRFECAQLAAAALHLPGNGGWTPQQVREQFAEVLTVSLEEA
jgi:hypothetical protein